MEHPLSNKLKRVSCLSMLCPYPWALFFVLVLCSWTTLLLPLRVPRRNGVFDRLLSSNQEASCIHEEVGRPGCSGTAFVGNQNPSFYSPSLSLGHIFTLTCLVPCPCSCPPALPSPPAEKSVKAARLTEGQAEGTCRETSGQLSQLPALM